MKKIIGRRIFDETLKKLKRFEGVKGVIVTNTEGLPISTTYDTDKTEKIAAHITSLIGKARTVVSEIHSESPNEQMSFLTLTTANGEVLIAPEEEYILIVMKDKGVKIF
ncbi:MAG: roadblock/LC7 domain-containing protein [Candidatus Helarchaeota archaeon]